MPSSQIERKLAAIIFTDIATIDFDWEYAPQKISYLCYEIIRIYDLLSSQDDKNSFKNNNLINKAIVEEWEKVK